MTEPRRLVVEVNKNALAKCLYLVACTLKGNMGNSREAAKGTETRGQPGRQMVYLAGWPLQEPYRVIVVLLVEAFPQTLPPIDYQSKLIQDPFIDKFT